jgi:hypothetical protein
MRVSAGVLLVLTFLMVGGELHSQEGRIFRITPDTRAIWEFNDSDSPLGIALADGAVIPDLSGNGNDAFVKNNGSGAMQPGGGSELCEGDFSVTRANEAGAAHVATNGDGSAFEFGEDESFSIELYVVREEVTGNANWGILAGTWHSRTLINDTEDPIANGAWYGYGYIRHNEGGGWYLNTSPINPDRSFNPSYNEIKSGIFDIPAGEHYLVSSFDRENGIGTVYLDGLPVAEVSIPPGTAFYAPEGHDPCHFAFMTGVDDLSRNAYRTSPSGYSISAARVLSRALSAEEVEENSFLIQDCEPIPLAGKEEEILAVLTTSTREALVDQCVTLSGANSTGGDGEDIISYEWKIGDGAYSEEGPVFELSFDEPTEDDGVEVSLRVTDGSGNRGVATVNIAVSHQVPVANIRALVNGEGVGGDQIWLANGSVLTLDGSGSTTPVSAVAFLCPAEAEQALPAVAIGEYLWDLDSDGEIDETGVEIELPPAVGPDEFTVTLTVVNEVGSEATATIDVSVVGIPDGAALSPPGRIFMETDDAIAIWEFNLPDLNEGDPLTGDILIEDFAGNGLDAVVEANDGGELVAGPGDAVFDDNASVSKSFGGVGRIVVNEDDDQFEFSQDQDFSIELYLNREEVLGCANWGVLAGTWHSRNLADDNLDEIADGAWYGYGFVRPGGSEVGGQVLFNMSPINSDGTFTPSWNEIKTPIFEIPAGTHYVVATVSRSTDPQRASVYLDGEFMGGVDLPAGQAFISPIGHDHARFMFFAGEDDASRNQYRVAPSGYSIDAARVSSRALSAEEIEENHVYLRAGYAVPLQEGGPVPKPGENFVRGDANADGAVNLTDGVVPLLFLFSGGAPPACMDAADANDTGAVEITDAIIIFSWLFTGGVAPVEPSPTSPGYPVSDCGPDATEDGLSCEAQGPVCD